MGSCNALNDQSNRICVLNKAEDLNLNVFNMITRIKWWNNNNCWCQCKSPKDHNTCEKDYILNPSPCTCENGEYLQSIIDDLVITCDEIVENTKFTSTKTV